MTTMKKNRVFLATVVFLSVLLTTNVATGDCLVGDIMYSEGDSVGTIGWECHKDNNKTYDGTESVCQNGQVVRKPVVLECSGTVANLCHSVCGPRQIGGALCLSTTTDVPEHCANATLREPSSLDLVPYHRRYRNRKTSFVWNSWAGSSVSIISGSALFPHSPGNL